MLGEKAQLYSVGINNLDVEELADLLEQAVASTNVVHFWGDSPPSQPMDVDNYRSLLQSFRERYDPTARERARHFKPTISDKKVNKLLLRTIRSHLGHCIRDDRLKSALHATLGGDREGFTVQDLLAHWLDIAIARGPKFAAVAFIEGVSNPVIYQEMALLRQLRIKHEIMIADGVRITPQAESTNSLPPYLPGRLDTDYLPSWTDLRLADFVHGSILIIDRRVSPAFIDPTKDLGSTIPPHDAGIFEYEDISNESHSFKLDQFCEALSLIVGSGITIRSPASWRYLDDNHICKVGSPPFYGLAMDDQNKPDTRLVNASEETIHWAARLYWARERLDKELTSRVNVAITRLLRSYESRSLVDKFIDLGIALESLYLDGIKDELRFRLALHAAWHLGDDVEGRRLVMRDFKKVYDLRSDAVHTGTVKDTQEVRGFLVRVQEYCRLAIINIISEGKFPDWSKLVLG